MLGPERAGALTELLRESHAILREDRYRLPPGSGNGGHLRPGSADR